MMRREEDCAQFNWVFYDICAGSLFYNNEKCIVLATVQPVHSLFLPHLFLPTSTMASSPDQAVPAPNDTALWHVISTGYTSQYDLPNTVRNAPGSWFTHTSTNTGLEATESGLL
jgi:hypothetical protein